MSDIVDERSVPEMTAALTVEGIDVTTEMDRGAFSILTKQETYLQSGEFEPLAMIEIIANTVQQSTDGGFSGLRAAGEMTWALGSVPGCDKVIEFEARLNHFFPGQRLIGLCQYNRKRFAPRILKDVLRTHPVAILGDNICQNIYSEDPEPILGGPSDESIRLELVENITKQVQNLCLSLRPSILDDLGLISALRLHLPKQMDSAELVYQFKSNLNGRLSSDVETACFRVVQEALTNILRHAQANRVGLEIYYSDSSVQLIIEDDGKGFNVAKKMVIPSGGFSLGLIAMEERVSSVGGKLEIDSYSRGTKIHVRIPIHHEVIFFNDESISAGTTSSFNLTSEEAMDGSAGVQT